MLLIFFSVVYSFCYGVFSESFGLDKTIMKPITPYPPEMTLMKSEPTYYTGAGCISGCNFVSLKMK